MNWINRLSRRWRFGIDNLMIYITATMLLIYIFEVGLRFPLMDFLAFDRSLILSGQVWRAITFIFAPINTSILFFALSLYFYYFIGNTLENEWGAPRFTFYYLCGVVGLIIAGFIMGGTTNHYLNLSLFFAFAHLFPNHQVLLFFILPVKMKYLAYLNWFYFLISFLQGNGALRLAIVFSLLNYFLFFGPEIFCDTRDRLCAWRRRRRYKREWGSGPDNWRR